PLSEEIDNFRRMEDAGASAIVHYSLFEEQITHETLELNHHLSYGTESYAESLTYFPEPDDFVLGPEEYLEHIQKAKEAVDIPVIASLNGHTLGGWVKYARYMQEAGADALELNIYFLPTDPDVTGEAIEQRYLEIVKAVKSNIHIPVAVKLAPFFSSMANMAKRLVEAGADGLVLFNRFYQPDIDLENLEVKPNVILSTPTEMRLPLRWIAILYGKIKASLAATTGIHTYADVLKMLMAGADVTMMCSALLKHGIEHIGKVLRDMEWWMQEFEYESVEQMKGSMSHKSTDNPEAFERANYMKALQRYSREHTIIP
ncbi:MAG: dihydroorotate dehydrogenase-like protein, partial [Calditrichaeota bacterium]